VDNIFLSIAKHFRQFLPTLKYRSAFVPA